MSIVSLRKVFFSDFLGPQSGDTALMGGLVLMPAQYSLRLEEPPLRNKILQNVTEQTNNTISGLGAVALPFHEAAYTSQSRFFDIPNTFTKNTIKAHQKMILVVGE